MASLSWFDNLISSVLSRENVVAVVVFLIVTCLVRCYLIRRSFVNIPPGPRPWPVVGNFGGFFVPLAVRRRLGLQAADNGDTNVAQFLWEQTPLYGNVFSLFLGSQLIVVLNGYEAVRDALSNHPEVFSDRPDIPIISIMTKRKGKGTFLKLLVVLVFTVQRMCLPSVWSVWQRCSQSLKRPCLIKRVDTLYTCVSQIIGWANT